MTYLVGGGNTGNDFKNTCGLNHKFLFTGEEELDGGTLVKDGLLEGSVGEFNVEGAVVGEITAGFS